MEGKGGELHEDVAWRRPARGDGKLEMMQN